MGTQEPVDGAHEFDLEFGSKETFKPLLGGGVFGEVDKVVGVGAEMKRFVSCRCGRIGRGWDTLEEKGIMKAQLETHVHEDFIDHLVPGAR